jgi:hypothetical protein
MAITGPSGDTCGMRQVTGWLEATVAALALAAASTFADLVWALWIPRHRALFGLVHGALLFMLLGVVLGIVASRSRADTGGGALVPRAAGAELFAGLAAAAAFYLLFGLIGWAAMFVAWMGVWMLTAFVYRWIGASTESRAATLVRGVTAALLSGVAFWAISGIWLGGSTRNPDYALNFVSWLIAFLPGFACLLLRPAPSVAPRR